MNRMHDLEHEHQRDVARREPDVVSAQKPSQQSTTSPEGAPKLPWMIVVMPTVPRKGDEGSQGGMLLKTLRSIEDELRVPSPLTASVRVVVMNQRPGHHPAFTQARKAMLGKKWIDFVDNARPLPDEGDSLPIDPEFASKNQEPPTDRVRRQTLDVVSLLKLVEGRSEYVLLYEDDFHFCENSLMALHYMIQRAHNYAGANKWSALRCGMGLTGIVMQNAAEPAPSATGVHPDIKRFRQYLERHYHRRPPDHLAVEFYAKESNEAALYFGGARHVMAFRYNLFRHDGRHSTLRSAESWDTPQCFHELIAPLIFPVEAWDPVECKDDDLWPCKSDRARASLLLWNRQEEALVSRHRDVVPSKE